jgi:hypothetical protein
LFHHRNEKSIFLASLQSKIPPLQIPLEKGGTAFWLDSRTVAHVLESGEDKDKKLELYALSVSAHTDSDGHPTNESIRTIDGPVLVGTFPTTTAANFRYSLASGLLVFSDYVYPDGNLNTVKEQDEAWENRGTTALVYDSGYERHWDHWIGPKRSSLFSVHLTKDADGKWVLGPEFVNPLVGTGHVGVDSLCSSVCLVNILQSTPVEPFGDTGDFDISESHIVYTAKDPQLPESWHTKQNVHF